MADEKYPPHPLVVELAKELTKSEGKRSKAGDKLAKVEQTFQTSREAGTVSEQAGDDVDAAAISLVDEMANNPALPELHTFAGYLGGAVKDDTKMTQTIWRLLYLDAKLRTWLLVGQDSILLRKDVKDDTSPSGRRDHIWVKADASVSQGEGPPQKNEIQARFLRGDFVSAGDFAASVTGGTYAPVTGPLCPLTPGCCGRRTK